LLIKFVKPTLLDIQNMQELIADEVKKDVILNRSDNEIATNIRSYTLIKKNNELIGFSALHIHTIQMAEIRSLIITDKYQGFGFGKKLILENIIEAKKLNLKEILVLTYKKEFFEKLNFKKIDKNFIPEIKIWTDCENCKYNHLTCDEIALIKKI